jgi:predicted O-methyltransferase YrrM
MKYFAAAVIQPYIRERGYRRLLEIGASYGVTTDALLELASITIDIVDPCLDADLTGKYRGDTRVRVHRGISLEILPAIEGSFDCILIDGDHNWYTVYH